MGREAKIGGEKIAKTKAKDDLGFETVSKIYDTNLVDAMRTAAFRDRDKLTQLGFKAPDLSELIPERINAKTVIFRRRNKNDTNHI